MDSSELSTWMRAEGLESSSGNVTTINDLPGGEWSKRLFEVFEERTGFPLSVARGRTGSYGPFYAPRVLQVLGRDLDDEGREHLVERMITVVEQTGDWLETFAILRDESR